MSQELATKKVPLLEAARRCEELSALVSEGVNIDEELTKELVEQIQTDLVGAINRRFYLKKTLESQVASVKEMIDMLRSSVKSREGVLESIQRTTTLALEQFPNINASGDVCKVSLKKCPAALRHDVKVNSKSFSNIVAQEDTTQEMAPYLKVVSFLQLDVEHLKESLLIEEYSWARLEQKNTCQFRAR